MNFDKKFLPALVCTLTLSACGVHLDAGPRSLDVSQFKVTLSAPREFTAAEIARRANLTGVVIYFIDGIGLRPVVAVQSGRPSPQSIINLLANVDGTSAPRVGFRSGLELEADIVKSAELVGRLAIIDFDRRFLDINGAEQILILGQVTLSIVANGIANAVQFRVDNNEFGFTSAKGFLLLRPAQRSDFVDLLTM